MATYSGSDKRLQYLFTASNNDANDYDSTATYVVDSYCKYQGTLYKCITAVEQAEDFDSDKWTAVKIVDEMGSGGGGGGTTVIANPSGPATVDLEKLQVGTTIYDTSGSKSWTGTQAEYEQQESQIADGTQVNITDDEVQALVIPSYDIYSTQEREIGVWHNGKPLYQKTIHISALPSTIARVTAYAHSISDIDEICDYEGIVHYSSGGASKFDRLAMGDQGTLNINNAGCIIAYVDKTNININVGSDRSTCSADFTIKYTKTTDVAGSGLWVPNGEPAEHYSTDEQVAGTWLGETMYKRTIYVNLTFRMNAGWQDTGVNISYVKKLIKAEAQNNSFLCAVCSVLKNGNNLNITSIINAGSATISITYITIWYTK